jgi:hypothetical protein
MSGHDDFLHELRLAIGGGTMDVSDALGADGIIDQLQEALGALQLSAEILRGEDLAANVVHGLLTGLVTAAVFPPGGDG